MSVPAVGEENPAVLFPIRDKGDLGSRGVTGTCWEVTGSPRNSTLTPWSFSSWWAGRDLVTVWARSLLPFGFWDLDPPGLYHPQGLSFVSPNLCFPPGKGGIMIFLTKGIFPQENSCGYVTFRASIPHHKQWSSSQSSILERGMNWE